MNNDMLIELRSLFGLSREDAEIILAEIESQSKLCIKDSSDIRTFYSNYREFFTAADDKVEELEFLLHALKYVEYSKEKLLKILETTGHSFHEFDKHILKEVENSPKFLMCFIADVNGFSQAQFIDKFEHVGYDSNCYTRIAKKLSESTMNMPVPKLSVRAVKTLKKFEQMLIAAGVVDSMPYITALRFASIEENEFSYNFLEAAVANFNKAVSSDISKFVIHIDSMFYIKYKELRGDTYYPIDLDMLMVSEEKEFCDIYMPNVYGKVYDMKNLSTDDFNRIYSKEDSPSILRKRLAGHIRMYDPNKEDEIALMLSLTIGHVSNYKISYTEAADCVDEFLKLYGEPIDIMVLELVAYLAVLSNTNGKALADLFHDINPKSYADIDNYYLSNPALKRDYIFRVNGVPTSCVTDLPKDVDPLKYIIENHTTLDFYRTAYTVPLRNWKLWMSMCRLAEKHGVEYLDNIFDLCIEVASKYIETESSYNIYEIAHNHYEEYLTKTKFDTDIWYIGKKQVPVEEFDDYQLQQYMKKLRFEGSVDQFVASMYDKVPTLICESYHSKTDAVLQFLQYV